MPVNPDFTPNPEAVVDFPYPELIVMRAAWLYAQSDPVMQPRAQYLEEQYKDLMYQLIERDERHTDAPLQNDFHVPVDNSIHGSGGWHGNPIVSGGY